MTCIRFDLRRLFPLYLDGEAPSQSVRRIERHLLDCSECRGALVQMRSARSDVRSLPRVDGPRIAVAVPGQAHGERRFARAPRFLQHIAADVTVAAALFVVFTLVYTHAAAANARPYDWTSFRRVPIADIASSSDPHVIAEGIVAPAAGEGDDEGSHRFRLVDPQLHSAFVVCEILDGDRLTSPRSGSRVRVWGVSRYDSRSDHRWYEIHPVLRIEVVR